MAGGEFFRANETPHHRIKQHDQRDEHAVTAPGLHPAKIRIAANELIGHPDKGDPEKIALRPIQHEARRHPLDQVRQHVSRNDGDERGIAEEHNAQQDGQIFQGLKRLCARDEHDERSDVAARDDQDACQRHAQERLCVPPLPRTAKSPTVPDPERKSAKCADRQEEADEIAEPPPNLQNRQGDVAEDGIQPRDDGRHGRSRSMARVARSRSRMPGTWLPAAAPIRTSKESRRVMPVPTSEHGILPYQTTASIEGAGPISGKRRLTHLRLGVISGSDQQWLERFHGTRRRAGAVAADAIAAAGRLRADKPICWSRGRRLTIRSRRCTGGKTSCKGLMQKPHDGTTEQRPRKIDRNECRDSDFPRQGIYTKCDSGHEGRKMALSRTAQRGVFALWVFAIS